MKSTIYVLRILSKKSIKEERIADHSIIFKTNQTDNAICNKICFSYKKGEFYGKYKLRIMPDVQF